MSVLLFLVAASEKSYYQFEEIIKDFSSKIKLINNKINDEQKIQADRITLLERYAVQFIVLSNQTTPFDTRRRMRITAIEKFGYDDTLVDQKAILDSTLNWISKQNSNLLVDSLEIIKQSESVYPSVISLLIKNNYNINETMALARIFKRLYENSSMKNSEYPYRRILLNQINYIKDLSNVPNFYHLAFSQQRIFAGKIPLFGIDIDVDDIHASITMIKTTLEDMDLVLNHFDQVKLTFSIESRKINETLEEMGNSFGNDHYALRNKLKKVLTRDLDMIRQLLIQLERNKKLNCLDAKLIPKQQEIIRNTLDILKKTL